MLLRYPWTIFKSISMLNEWSNIWFYSYEFRLLLPRYIIIIPTTISAVQFSHLVVFDSLWPHVLQHSRLPCPITNFQSLSKLMSIELMMPPNHPILCHPLSLLPSIFSHISVFSNEPVLHIRCPKYWSFSSASILPMNIKDWFPLESTGLISLQSKGLSRVFSTP